MTLIYLLITSNLNRTGDGNRPECTNRSCPERFARLVGNGASTIIMSIASVFAVTLMIVNL